MKEEGIPFKPGDGDEIAAAVRETVSRIVDVICSQEVDDSDSDAGDAVPRITLAEMLDEMTIDATGGDGADMVE